MSLLFPNFSHNAFWIQNRKEKLFPRAACQRPVWWMLLFLLKKGNIFKYFSLGKTLIIHIYICIGSEARFPVRPTEDAVLIGQWRLYLRLTLFWYHYVLSKPWSWLFKTHAKCWAKIRLVAPNTNYHKGGSSDKVLQCIQPKLTWFLKLQFFARKVCSYYV